MLQSESQAAVRSRHHSLSLEAGLYLLRYVATHAPNDPPFIDVHPAEADATDISFLPGPGVRGERLVAPGSYILVQALRASSLDLRVFATRPDGSVDAEVQLERIAIGDQPQRSAGAQASTPSVKGLAGLEILAHVSHRGDVRSKPGEWICGPDLPMPIEGLAIHWSDKPDSLEIGCSVDCGHGPQRLRDMKNGQFAGTRGTFTPIIGLALDLHGPRAAAYELKASALFLGSSVTSKQGGTVSFSGPTGREPLLGLRLAVVAAQAAHTHSDRNSPGIARRSRTIAMHQVGRVRVYRPEFASPH